MERGDSEIDGTRETSDDEVHPIVRELTRIFGDLDAAESSGGFYLLPLVSEEEMLAFLRSLPPGTPWSELPQLAATFRAAHPNPSVADDEDLV
jgi:hypothetical protein